MKKKKFNAGNHNRLFLNIGIMLLALVFVVWLLVTVVVFRLGDFAEQAGQIGDSFGAVNALFSGLAFCGSNCYVVLSSENTKKRE